MSNENRILNAVLDIAFGLAAAILTGVLVYALFTLELEGIL